MFCFTGSQGDGKLEYDRGDRRNVTLRITFHLSRSHIPAWGDGCLKVCLYNCKANEKASRGRLFTMNQVSVSGTE